MRIGGIIQARLGSTRLPGKVLRQLGGMSVLERVVSAARSSASLDELVVATTTLPADEAIVTECARLGVPCHRGPSEDVLTRFLGAMKDLKCDAIARFTADCPLLDPELIRGTAAAWRAMPGLDYLSTCLTQRTLPAALTSRSPRPTLCG